MASILAGLVAAWNSITTPPPVEFTELTPVVSGTTIVITANTAGNPCTLTVSTTGGATYSIAHTQSATGPNDFANAQNWSGGTAPVNSDTIVFDNGNVNCSYGISTSLTGITMIVSQGYSGKIGLPFINSNNTTTYAEYRTTSLTLAGGTVTINAPNCKQINMAFGANTATVNIQSNGQRISQYTPVILITGGNGSSQLSITKGDVGLAFYQGQTSNLPTILTSYQTSASSDVTLYCGSGTTLGTITQNGGTITVNSNVTTYTVGTSGGVAYVLAGGITTAYVENGTMYYSTTGTLGTITIAGKSVLDFSQSPLGKTITNPILVYGDSASINDPAKTINSGTLSVTTEQTVYFNVFHGSGSICTFA